MPCTFLDEPVADFPLSKIGPLVENLPIFPNRVNFEVARVLDNKTYRGAGLGAGRRRNIGLRQRRLRHHRSLEAAAAIPGRKWI